MRSSVKLMRHGNSFHLTVPPPIRKFLGWEHGDELMLLVTESKTLRVVTIEQFMDEDYTRRRSLERVEAAKVTA
jgi:bifunctional DNA-binding transcriptional regulator/antitoxin component of YhaV-PrlF toxin-antitoxin module